MKQLRAAILSLALALPVGVAADEVRLRPASFPLLEEQEAEIRAPSAYRGWDHLVNRLLAHGVPLARVKAVYQSPRMPRFTNVPFSVVPREPQDWYKAFRSPKRIKHAVDFLATHRTTFERAEKRFGVSRYAVAALLLIETHFGKNTGSHSVVYRLSRLANVADPRNLRWNYERLRKEDDAVTMQQVIERGAYLEQLFLPEVAATMEIAATYGFNVFNIKGSSAGAFGLPQFLPSSFLKYGYDGNGDGRVSLFQISDAIHSTANFLAQHGWREGISDDQKRKVFWHYNRSEPYVETALEVSKILAKRAP